MTGWALRKALKSTTVRGRAVGLDAKDGVVGSDQSMGATRTRLHAIEDAVDELHILHAQHIAA